MGSGFSRICPLRRIAPRRCPADPEPCIRSGEPLLVVPRSSPHKWPHPHDGSAELHRQRGDDSGRALRLRRPARQPEGDAVHPHDQPWRPHRRSRAHRQPQSHRRARQAARLRHAARKRLLDRRRAGGDSEPREKHPGRLVHHEHGRLEPEAVRGETSADDGRARCGGTQQSRPDLSERRRRRRSRRGLRQQPCENVLRGKGRPRHTRRRHRERRAVHQSDRRAARDSDVRGREARHARRDGVHRRAWD